MEQYDLMWKLRVEGSVTKLWTKLAESEVLQESISEYFKLAELCLTMILGSVEDERVFSALGFLKSKLRNKLDKNLENCLRLYTSTYEINTFPYERALQLWKKKCQRRGLGNVSSNDISNSGSGAGTSSIDVEDDDYIDCEEGMLTRENMQHGLFGLDAKGLEELDDEMMWQV